MDAAGLVTAVPGQGWWEDSGFTIVEHPPLPKGTGRLGSEPHRRLRLLRGHGIPILRGRTFNDSLRLDQANEIIISEAFAQEIFSRAKSRSASICKTNDKTYTIVGIVGDTRFDIGEPAEEMKYYPLTEGRENYGTLVIRSRRDVEQLALPVQRVIQEMDHDLPVAECSP